MVFFFLYLSLSLFFYPFRRSSRRSDLLRQDLMLFPGEWNRHDMLREREGLWNLFFVVVLYWVTKSLSLKIRCRREKRLTWGLFFFWRTVAAGGNHQRGEKLMREDAPHFEENERRRLVVSFFFFFSPVLEQRASFLLCVQIRPENAKIEKEAKEKLSSADLYVRRVSGVTGALELSQPVLTQVTGRKPVSTGKHTSSSLFSSPLTVTVSSETNGPF